MFGLSAFPAACQLAGMLKLPDSPQHLVAKHNDRRAGQVLKALHGFDDVQLRQELTNIRLSLGESQAGGSCWSMFSGENSIRSSMLIAVGLVMAQQFTGQPNVLYYAPTIFQQVGFCGHSAAALATVGLGVVKVSFPLHQSSPGLRALIVDFSHASLKIKTVDFDAALSAAHRPNRKTQGPARRNADHALQFGPAINIRLRRTAECH